MGVEFHWQLDLEDEWEAPPPPQRRRRIRWQVAGIILAALGVGATVAAGRFWHQVRQSEEHLKRDLQAVVNLEAQALRSGDPALFLSLQDRYDTTWYGRQKERIPAWDGAPILEPGQAGNLTILKAALLPDGRAWAEVAWAMNNRIYRRVQFYRRVGDLWLRTGPRPEYFGPEQAYATEHFAFKYLAQDEPTVKWMAAQLETWRTAICADLGCDELWRVNVAIALDEYATGDYRPPHGFTLISPRLQGAREDGAPTPQEQQELAEMLIYLQVAQQPGDTEADKQPYLLLEFINWETRRLGLADEETPPTPLLDFVMASRGAEGVRVLLAALGQTDSEEEALHRVTGARLLELDGTFSQYLAALLAAERQIVEGQRSVLVGPTSGLPARQFFEALLAGEVGTWRAEMWDAFGEERPGYYAGLPVGPLHIDRWGRLDETTVWAEVLYSGASGDAYAAGLLRRVEFFRLVDGAWRHTRPDRRFLGQEVTLNSEHFRLVCHEREAEWMAGELARLESLYRRFTARAHVEFRPGERLVVRIIVPTATWSSLRLSPDGTELWIPSPYFVGWNADRPGDYVADWVAPSLLARLAFRAAGVEHLSAALPPTRQVWLSSLLAAWQYEIVGSDLPPTLPLLDTPRAPSARAAQASRRLTLSEIGQATLGPEPPARYWGPDEWELVYQQVSSVMNYIGETYGPRALLSLLQVLPEVDSLESWLRLGLAVDLESFEANWQAWLREQATR